MPHQLLEEVQAVSHNGKMLEITHPASAPLHKSRRSNIEIKKDGGRFGVPNRSTRVLSSCLAELNFEIKRISYVSADRLKLRLLVSEPEALILIVARIAPVYRRLELPLVYRTAEQICTASPVYAI